VAQFDAGINLEVKVDRALRSIDRVERRMAQLSRKANVEVRVNNLNKTNKEVGKTARGISALSKQVNTLGAALERLENDTLSRLPTSLQFVVAALKAVSVTADDVAKKAIGVNQSFKLTNTAGYTRDIQQAVVALGRLADEQTRLQNARNIGTNRTGNTLERQLGLVNDRIGNTAPRNSADLNSLIKQRIDLQTALNNQVRIQADIEDRIRKTQIDQNDAVRKNIRASEASRQGSGFAAFSQRASQTSGERRGASARQDLAEVDRLTKAYLDSLNEVNRAATNDRQRRLQAELKNIETRKNAELAARDKVFKDILDTNKQLLDDFDLRLGNRQRKKKEARDNRKNRNDRSRNLLLGAGFPLLFGGGPGSILGGVGGALTGGFGAQILGSGLGSALDTAIQSAAEFAEGISNVSTALETATNANLISTKKLEKELNALAEAGFSVAAGIQAQEDYAKTISAIDFERAQAAATSIDNVSREWAQFTDKFTRDLLILVKGFADVSAAVLNYNATLKLTGGIIDTAKEKGVSKFGTRGGQLTQDVANARLRFTFIPTDENKRKLFDAVKQLEKEFPIIKLRGTLTLEQKQINKLQGQLESIQGEEGILKNTQSVQTIIDRYTQDSKKVDDLRQRSIRAIESAEQRIADLRLSLERKVEDMRLEAIGKANRIEDEKAKQRLEKLKAAAGLASAEFAASFKEDDVTKDIAVGFEKIASDINLELAQGVEDRAKLERDYALEQRKFELQTVRTRLDAEKAVARTRESLERNLADIRKEVIRIEDNVNKDKFTLQKRLDELALKRLKIETKILELTLKVNDQLNETFSTYFKDIYSIIAKARNLVEGAKPETTGGASSVPAANVGGVSFDNLDAVTNRIRGLNQELQTLLQNNTKFSDADQIRYAERLIEQTDAIQKSLSPLEKRNKLLQEQKELDRLVAEGFTESDASAIIAGQKELENYVDKLNATRTGLEKLRPIFINAFGAGSVAVTTLDNQIKQLDTRIKQVTGQAGKFKDSFEKVSEMEKVAQEAGGLLVNGLVDGLQTAITETDRLGEAMRELASDILLAIGRALILSAIKTGINALANNAGEPGDGVGLFSMLSRGFAEGGYVTGPTPAVVGEGGEPEYIIPASKMDGAMARYSGGTRGDAVIDGPGSAEGGGGVALAEAPMSINISGGVTQIGNDEYIRKDQLPSIVAQASKAGEQRTLRKLQMSPSSRRRLGM